MARKVAGFERVLGTRELFAVAYGEIGSSIYFALAIVVGAALGLTPLVLLATGALFLLVALSYAEGATALPETGGAETFTRRAFNDLVGFVTGWALTLDYVIVVALAAISVPHYAGVALGAETLRRSPWDIVAAAFVIAAIAVARLLRHTRVHVGLVVLAVLDLAVQGAVVVLGLVVLYSHETLIDGFSLAPGQTWNDVLFAVPLAMLAYTGLETVANYAQEVEEPKRDLPRGMLTGIGLVVLVTVAISAVAVSAYPAEAGKSRLAENWLEAPVAGIVAAFDAELGGTIVDVLRVLVGITGVLILLAAATTSMSGCARLAHSMASHGMIPRAFGRFGRRSLVSGEAIIAIALVAIAAVIVTGVHGDAVRLLASVFSFGVLAAFTLAQLAVVKLRFTEPALPRPFRAGPDIPLGRARLPLAALVGIPMTATAFVLSMVTHPGARYVGPLWVAVGLLGFWATRWWNDRSVLDDIDPLSSLPVGAGFRRILVPMKIGEIGEEMVATAIALAAGRDATIDAITVVRVPRRYELEGPLPAAVQEQADAAIEEARLLGEDNDIEVHAEIVRARAIGFAVVDEARRRNSDLIVLGSSPRWRKQSRFFSPTVDYVLQRAPCEVLVVAFPEGVVEA
ncbi:MAG: universal stress protein [Gaiellales bacterium]